MNGGENVATFPLRFNETLDKHLPSLSGDKSASSKRREEKEDDAFAAESQKTTKRHRRLFQNSLSSSSSLSGLRSVEKREVGVAGEKRKVSSTSLLPFSLEKQNDDNKDISIVGRRSQKKFRLKSNSVQPFPINASSSSSSSSLSFASRRISQVKSNKLPPVTLPPIQISNSFTYTSGQRGPLSGSIARTPDHRLLSSVYGGSPRTPLSSLSAPLTPSLLTPIFTRAVRTKSSTSENDVDGGGSGKNQMLRNYFPDMKVKVFVASWNMHEQKDVTESLDDMLLPEDVEILQDIYSIGVQECYMDQHEWDVRLQETLGESHVLVQSSRKGCLQLSIFVRRDLIWYCSDLDEDCVITSFKPAKRIKTKGGLAISFKLFGTAFLFINSHLSAHEERMTVRHDEVLRISQNISLPKGKSYGAKSDVTYRFDCVFWFGDMNYRVELPRSVVDTFLERGEKRALLQNDQLFKEMRKGNVFSGFSEQPILFEPTYKFDPGKNRYDTSSKARTPSWTDRILFKSRYGTITGHKYFCCPQILSSDHKPVFGLFQVLLQPPPEEEEESDNFPADLLPIDFDKLVFAQGNARRRAKRRYRQSKSLSVSSTAKHSAICTIL